MKKIVVLISALVVLIIAFSGCLGNNKSVNGTDNNSGVNSISGANVSEISTLKNVPANFSYDATLPLTVNDIKSNYKAENVSGILEGSEGYYNDSNNTDYYIDVIKLENQEATSNFISTYKSSFPALNNNVSRFTDDSLNGHSAVKITTYVTYGGKVLPRYSYIWNNENYVIVVIGNTDNESLTKQLAEATGY
jgi:hypothetical protein